MTFYHVVKTMERQEFEEKLRKTLEDITSYYSMKVEEYSYEQINMLIIKVYRKYYEIDEFCAENVENEEEFDECFIEELEEINNQDAINLELKYADKNFSLEVYPILCDSNYCEVGLCIEIKTIDTVDYDILYEIVKQIINLTFNLIYYDSELTAKNIKQILESS